MSEEVERLARLAYPDAPSEMLELLTKNQCIDAITDGEMHLWLRQNHPKRLTCGSADSFGTGGISTGQPAAT